MASSTRSAEAEAADVPESAVTAQFAESSNMLYYLVEFPKGVGELLDRAEEGEEVAALHFGTKEGPPTDKRGRGAISMEQHIAVRLHPEFLDQQYLQDKVIIPSLLTGTYDDLTSDSSSHVVYQEEKPDTPTASTATGEVTVLGHSVARLKTRYTPRGREFDWYRHSIRDRHVETDVTRDGMNSGRPMKLKLTANTQLDRAKRAKLQNRRVADSADAIQLQLIQQFAKYEYFTIDELQSLIKQPRQALQDALREIGDYETSGEHRNKWHLKAEFRS